MNHDSGGFHTVAGFGYKKVSIINTLSYSGILNIIISISILILSQTYDVHQVVISGMVAVKGLLTAALGDLHLFHWFCDLVFSFLFGKNGVSFVTA